jgi:hypothetical protein
MRPKDKRDYRRNGFYEMLMTHVGQPWNDVYAKLRRMLDPRNSQDQQQLDGLKWKVEQHCEIVDGVVYQSASYYGRAHKVSGLYVHPETGILGYVERKERQRRRKPIEAFQLDERTDYVRCEGLWYRLVYEYHEPGEVRRVYRFDDLNPERAADLRILRRLAAHLRGPGDTYAEHYAEVAYLQRIERGKFQCSKKEVEWIEFYLKHLQSGRKAEPEWVMRWEKIRQHLAQTSVARRAPSAPECKQAPAELIYGGGHAPMPQRTVF